MYRKITKKLMEWKLNKNKKPLIIKGARQVGKTHVIREFAQYHYDKLIEINFERDLNYVELFRKTRKPKDIITYIELGNLQIDYNKETVLIFFDEIQACPDALTALKFLAEESPYDIICSGSMLGVAIAGSTSFPVGYVETWDMYPMDFEEFLMAMNIPQKYLDTIIDAWNNNLEINELLHTKFNDIFTQYMICGGMPETVSIYMQTQSYVDVVIANKRIVNDYKNDMVKYGTGSKKIRAQECYASLPIQLAKENKKFQYNVIRRGYNARHYDTSLRWLEQSGIIYKLNRLSNITKPLEIATELNVFKVYASDVGLLLSQFNDSIIQEVVAGNLNAFKGALYENVIAQTLKSKGYEMFYYEPNSNSEIDFIIYFDGEVVPLEIKSGVHTQSKSFNNFINNHNSKLAFRISQKNIGYDENKKTYYLPYYLFSFLLDGMIKIK